jgi:GNAT superfamily N-acetyltransferase
MYILNLQDAVILLGIDKVSKDIKYMSILTYNLWYDKYYQYNLDKFPNWTYLYKLFMSIANNTNTSTYYNCYVCIDNMNIIGFISLNYNDFDIFANDMDNIYSLWLTDLFVWPEYRNQGVSTLLINHVINIAENINTELYLACEDTLLNYYKKYAFTIIDTSNMNYNIRNENWNFMMKCSR